MNEPEVGGERCLNESVSECLLAEDDAGNCTPEKDKRLVKRPALIAGGTPYLRGSAGLARECEVDGGGDAGEQEAGHRGSKENRYGRLRLR